jgi:hypothetical protein
VLTADKYGSKNDEEESRLSPKRIADLVRDETDEISAYREPARGHRR